MRLIESVVFMVVCFMGLRITLLPSYNARLSGIIMLFAGYMVLGREKTQPLKKKNSFLPYAGALIILGDVSFNLLFMASDSFLGLDFMTLLLGVMLISYNRIPQKYEAESRFMVVFLSVFFLTLSMPLAVLMLDSGSRAASYYTSDFIARPLALLLNLWGVKASSSMNWVFFDGREGPVSLSIGLSCSGAYSFAVFFSAFTAYVHVKYAVFNRRLSGLLLAGLLGTYLANLLRVFFTALAGYYYGKEALIFAHQNVGWIIFMAWVALFWFMGFRFFTGEKKRTRN